jgi:LysM repeat protein
MTDTPPATRRLSGQSRRLVGLLAVAVAVGLVAVDLDREGALEAAAAGVPDAVAAEPAAPAPALRGAPDAPLSGIGTDPTTGAGTATGAERPATAVPAPRVHVVADGETAGEIAERHGIPTSRLVRANGHVAPASLRPGDHLVLPDPDLPRARTPGEAMAARPELDALIDEIAGDYGWDPDTVKAVAWVESRWDQHVVSDRSAIGVMQVQPATGELMAEQIGRPINLYDVRDNVEAGVAYLTHLEGRWGGNLRALLAAYHQGPRAVRERGIYRVSDVYVDRILRHREAFAAGP